jgi:hypothetical protein
MKLLFSASFFVFSALSVAAQNSVLTEPYLLHPPSLVSVLANPEKYDGKRITVTGFLHVQFEDSGLYLSKEDADYLITENALWVRYSTDAKLDWRCGEKFPSTLGLSYFDRRYVTLSGTFNMKERGHMGAFSGVLEDVVSVLEQRRWFDGKKKVVNQDKDGRIKDKCL